MPDGRLPRVLEWVATGAAVVLLLIVAEWMMPLAKAPFPGHGERFAAMAAAPFAFAGEFPHRVLWPALAHALGWFGISPVGATRVGSGILLWAVYRLARSRGLSLGDARLLTAGVAVSGPVLMYQTMTCFSDSLNLAILVLQMRYAHRPALFWSLLFVGALSHELALFFVPWLIWLRRQHGARFADSLLALLGVGAAYAAFRLWVQSHGGGSYGFAYYFENMIWVPWGLPALWAMWLLITLVEFGPLLVCLGGSVLRPAVDLGGRTGAWLYIACMLPLMVLAYDVMRFATFWLVPVLIGAVALLQAPRGRTWFIALLLLAVACYRWQHPAASEQGGRAFTAVSAHVLPLVSAHLPMSAANGYAVTLELLRREAVIWSAALAGWLVVIAAAFVVRRQVVAGNTPRTRQNASP
jgi:hypothetical protein